MTLANILQQQRRQQQQKAKTKNTIIFYRTIDLKDFL